MVGTLEHKAQGPGAEERGWWGEDILLSDPELLEPNEAVALTYVEVLWMHRGHLDSILLQYPDERGFIRKAAVRLAVARGLRSESLPASIYTPGRQGSPKAWGGGHPFWQRRAGFPPGGGTRFPFPKPGLLPHLSGIGGPVLHLLPGIWPPVQVVQVHCAGLRWEGILPNRKLQ